MRVSLIVAMAENGVIGRDGDLPWRISEDLKRFKEITMGKPIVMGRKTWESIGRPLPGRPHIVISRDPAYEVVGAEGVDVVASLEAALARAGELIKSGAVEIDEVMIIGGAEIYRLALGRADRIYLTEVHRDIEGDTVFPDFDRAEWRETAREGPFTVGHGILQYSFVTYDRR
jgi:dihydrofolate reductase